MIKHGLHKHPLYTVWQHMLQRCGKVGGADDRHLRDYRDRGIGISPEWLNFKAFYEWAVLHGWNEDLQIDRIDNDKGYSPDNCKFSNRIENMNNRRNTLRFPDGTPFSDLCRSVGIPVTQNGRMTKQYRRISEMYRRFGKIHKELVEAINSQSAPDDIKRRYARYCLTQSE